MLTLGMLLALAGGESASAAPPPTFEAPIVLNPARQRPAPLAPRALLGTPEGAGGGIPTNCEYFDDFSSYSLTDMTNPPLSLSPLSGQLNPDGQPWSTQDFFGIADAATMTAAGSTHPQGLPPHGLLTPAFAVSARGTVSTPRNTSLGIAAEVRHREFFPILNEPVLISQDIYVSSPNASPRTTTWWSPLSFAEGTIYDRIFFGGSNLTGELAGFGDASGVMNRFLSLGRSPNGQGVLFYGSALTPVLRVPTNSWFTLMVHMSTTGYSVWVKTAVTTTVVPPFLDPRLASGQIPTIDGDPVGWVNTYPGFEDNVLTANVREGIGFATSAAGETVPLLGEFFQAPIFSSATFDGIQYGWGFDDPLNANFQPSDVFFANYCVSGVNPQTLCTADLNGDGVVNGGDITILLNVFGNPFEGFGPNDLNADGVINGADISAILNQFGPCT